MSKAELVRCIQGMPNLHWIQSCGAGFDQVGIPELAERNITVTRSAESHNVAVAEFALAFILSTAKRFPEFMRMQLAREWRVRGSDRGLGEVAGRTVGIVGFGAVGREIASRCQALGMRTIGLRRSPEPSDVDNVLGPRDLPRLLRESHYVVLAVPLTDETRGLIGANELRLMRRDAYLINVARGGVVVQDDLVRALKRGWIRGACLDVFEVEPLPVTSELWDLSNVVITPHCASDSPETLERSVREFEANLRRYLQRRPLASVVDLARGY
jgi:phosphoglycerate dehydrogenase-like enzyme